MNVFESIMIGLQEAVDFENGNTDVKIAVLTTDQLDSLTDEEQDTDHINNKEIL